MWSSFGLGPLIMNYNFRRGGEERKWHTGRKQVFVKRRDRSGQNCAHLWESPFSGKNVVQSPGGAVAGRTSPLWAVQSQQAGTCPPGADKFAGKLSGGGGNMMSKSLDGAPARVLGELLHGCCCIYGKASWDTVKTPWKMLRELLSNSPGNRLGHPDIQRNSSCWVTGSQLGCLQICPALGHMCF